MSALGQRWRTVIRVWAFLRKELVGVVRQPLLVVLLVLGPFLLLLLFGSGLGAAAPQVRTTVVASEGSAVAREARQYAEDQQTRLEITEVTGDLEQSLRRLRGGGLDLVVEFPEDADAVLATGQQPEIVFYHDFLDPIEADAMEIAMRRVVDDLNAQVAGRRVEAAQQEAGEVEERAAAADERVAAVRAALERGDEEEALVQLAALRSEVSGLGEELEATGLDGVAAAEDTSASDAVDDLAEQVDELAAEQGMEAPTRQLEALARELEGLRTRLAEFGSLPPGLFVRPFRGVAETVIEGPVNLSEYYAPAVLVLLVQHLAVTFLGLSVVRDSELGTTELLRVAPVSAAEVLVGKTLAYLLLTGGVSAGLLTLLVSGLDVPMRGSWPLLTVVLVVVALASTAFGFVVALLARTVAQAVTFAMLLLVANVFFSGFLLSLERYRQPVRAVPYLLPATYGIRLLREVMLRGDRPPLVPLTVLLVATVALFALAAALLRRRLRGT